MHTHTRARDRTRGYTRECISRVYSLFFIIIFVNFFSFFLRIKKKKKSNVAASPKYILSDFTIRALARDKGLPYAVIFLSREPGRFVIYFRIFFFYYSVWRGKSRRV